MPHCNINIYRSPEKLYRTFPVSNGQRPGVLSWVLSYSKDRLIYICTFLLLKVVIVFIVFIRSSCYNFDRILWKIFRNWLDLNLIKKKSSYSQFSHVENIQLEHGFKCNEQDNFLFVVCWTHGASPFNTMFILSITLWEDFIDSLHKISSLLSTTVTKPKQKYERVKAIETQRRKTMYNIYHTCIMPFC